MEVAAGTTLFSQGDEADRYYLIASGRLEVWAGSAASLKLMSTLGPGEGFGEMGLLLAGRRTAGVRCATDAVLYALGRDDFRHILHEHRGLSLALEDEMALLKVKDFLGLSSPFAALPGEALRLLALRFEHVELSAGTDLVRQGDPADAFYIIRSGAVDVLVRRDDGSEYRIATLGVGDPVGEQALVTGEPRVATVRATEPVEALRLTRDDFAAALQSYGDRASYFRQLTLRRQRPTRIDGWVIRRQVEADGDVFYVLKGGQRYLKLSEPAAFLWDLMDGERTVRDLAVAYYGRYQTFGLDAVLDAMMQLHAAGFVVIQQVDPRAPAPSAGRGRLRRLMSGSIVFPDVDRGVTAIHRVVAPLYARPAQAVLLLATLAGAAAFAALLLSGQRVDGELVGVLLAATLAGYALHVLAHEIGHAVTCKHFGADVHRAGLGWYLVMPVAFVDTSDIWLASRWRRAAVSFAGPYANFALSGLATLAVPFVGEPTRLLLLQFALAGYVLGLTNLNPLIEFDGYYVLMDWLEITNLRRKALAFVGSLGRGSRRRSAERRDRAIFVAYGALVILYAFVAAWSAFQAYRLYASGIVGSYAPGAAEIVGTIVAVGMALFVLRRVWRELRQPS